MVNRSASWFLVGVAIFASAPPASGDCPVLVGAFDTPGSAQSVLVSGAYAYVGDETGGVRVVDVSDPGAPVEVGHIDTRSARDVAVSGTHVVAHSDGGLWVIDVGDPFAPVEAGYLERYYWSELRMGVAVSGGYAYVAAGHDGLRVIDITKPSNPQEVGFAYTPEALDVAVAGSYAYVIDWNYGLLVFDVSFPSNPIEVGSLNPPQWWPYGVVVSGNYAYVADGYPFGGSGGLWVIDVSTPSSPEAVGYFFALYAREVAHSDGRAYLAGSNLWVIDVSSPSNPVWVGHHGVVPYAQRVSVSGRYVFLAAFESGVQIVWDCLVFADGFESGDTSAWTAVVP